MTTTPLIIRTVAEADNLLSAVKDSAAKAQTRIAQQSGDGLEMLRHMKFNPIGFHPIENRPLNLIEQINQTWTYAVAIAAARHLLSLHPDTGGLRLAPGAHASQALDIMSEVPGYIGAETFAAVNPRNNKKLQKDMAKLAMQTERHRYLYFMSPMFPGNERRSQFERDGIEVWSVDF